MPERSLRQRPDNQLHLDLIGRLGAGRHLFPSTLPPNVSHKRHPQSADTLLALPSNVPASSGVLGRVELMGLPLSLAGYPVLPLLPHRALGGGGVLLLVRRRRPHQQSAASGRGQLRGHPTFPEIGLRLLVHKSLSTLNSGLTLVLPACHPACPTP